MSGTPQGAAMAYPTTLTDSAGNTLTVAFQQHAATPNTTPPTVAGPSFTTVSAPLLFASNNQVNLLVPSTVSTAVGGTDNSLVDVVVTYQPTGGTAVSSSAYPVNAVNSDPGIFTIAADGQGNGAILDWPNYNVVGQSQPAAMLHGAASDTVMIYMTGLGAPSVGVDNNSGTGSGSYPGNCLSISSYLTSLGNLTAAPATADGLIFQSSLFNPGFAAPCLSNASDPGPALAPTSVTIGGLPGTVQYAGWVSDGIAGLYQVNVTLPDTTPTGGKSFYQATTDCSNPAKFTGAIASIIAPVQLPVCVTSYDGVVSQPGVMIWVAPRLTMTAPTVLTGSINALWPTTSGANVVAAGGDGGPYTYAVTSGGLPAGLYLSSTGAISGTPVTQGTYTVTVTATDASTPPITGSVTFNLTVGPVLGMTATPSAGGNSYTYSVTNAATPVFQVQASGGSPSYTYQVTSDTYTSGTDTTMSVDNSGNFSVAAGTATGNTYNVTITATDSHGLTGTFTFTITVTP